MPLFFRQENELHSHLYLVIRNVPSKKFIFQTAGVSVWRADFGDRTGDGCAMS